MPCMVLVLLIPALYDPSLDIAGFSFRLCPGDFHSQNIMIVDTSPRISVVIDWDFLTPVTGLQDACHTQLLRLHRLRLR